MSRDALFIIIESLEIQEREINFLVAQSEKFLTSLITDFFSKIFITESCVTSRASLTDGLTAKVPWVKNTSVCLGKSFSYFSHLISFTKKFHGLS